MTPSTTNTAAREVVDLAPNAPRPWRVSDRLTFEILDANGDPVGAIYGPDKDRQENMAIIVNAVNTLTQQQGGEQEARAFLAAEVSDGHIDMDFVRSKDAIRAISAALRSKQPAASEGDVARAVIWLGRIRNSAWGGDTALDTIEEALAAYDPERMARCANTSKQAAVEAVDSTFAEWLASEMPAGTVIGDPTWWANRIARQYQVHCTPRHPADDGATFSVTITDGGWKGSLEEWQARRKPTIGEQLDAALAGREAGEAGLG